MSTYQIHDIDTAPENSRPLLQGMKENLGMIPNLAAAMAESPELLKGFLTVREIYQGGMFTPGEIQVLSLTAVFENNCARIECFFPMDAETERNAKELARISAGLDPTQPLRRFCLESAASGK